MIRHRLGCALVGAWLLAPASAQAHLTEYVQREDPTTTWEIDRVDETPAGRAVHITLTSQTWRGIPWTHSLRLYEPRNAGIRDVALLFITGGSSRSRHKPSDDLQAFLLANACDARVAVLPQVPNQPLFGDRTEDDLIAHTFVQFLETGEEAWPLLQPMVKSAVAAMDAVQDVAAERGDPIERFVVTGASKRGWTTWLTGSVDDRVAAIAPLVIPTLNMKANTENQLELWGVYSEQIQDYTRRGLTETFDTPDGARLWRIVDPYFYLDRITVPILQVNGTNDRYWTHDSTRFYWDRIQADQHGVVYLPNAGHGLDEHRDYAINAVGALLRHVAAGKPLPELTWRVDRSKNGTIHFAVGVNGETERPKAATLWTTRSEDRDLRDDTWTEEPVEAPAAGSGEGDADGGTIAEVVLPAPEDGSLAALFDLTFEFDGLTYHLTTPIHEFRTDPSEDTNGGPAGP